MMIMDMEINEKLGRWSRQFKPYIVILDGGAMVLREDAPEEAIEAYNNYRELYNEISFDQI
ncbi:MAG: hypothetical protein Q4C56_08990 [Peptococcaceae bacterium]|nr:hypothetical protein [Peptococcaceae bacterium]